MKHEHVHKGRLWCWRCLWVTVSFPIEHLIWVKAPGLRNIAHLFGL